MMKEFSMHILDIAQNSIRANATKITIEIDENITKDYLMFSIEDNGCGMTKEMIEKIRDPFTTSRETRKVGLGIPFLEQTCLMCGGSLDIKSKVGVGTKLTCRLLYNSIDRPPMGDIASSIHLLVIMNKDVSFKYIHTINDKQYMLDTEEVAEILGDEVPIDSPEISEWLKQNIVEGLAELCQLEH